MPVLRPIVFPMLALPLFAQCSDAGVCALERATPTSGHRISLVGQYGRSGSPDDLTFQSLRLEGQFRLGPRTSVTAVLPFGRVSGPYGSTSGLGDAILVVEQSLAEGSWGRLSGQLGARFATGEDDAAALPQRYQLGLGSTDPLVGLRLDAPSWELGLGYQKAGARSANGQEPLKRGDDLLFHLGARGSLGQVGGSLKAVAIQRLGRSDLREPDGSIRTLPDSDRLQVNLVGGLSLPLDRGWSLETRLALPLFKRPDNTDGLKRALSVELGATYRF
ncbi:MAG: hypothetical protein HYZ13_14275 [Acidobacteria bacterium]|nr:hypothetical protein [Acidobacteriota bacterium]